MRRGSDAPDVRVHAMADIQQQQDVDRHVLALEIPDLLRLSIHSKDKILGAETAHGMVSAIHYLGIDTSQGDIAAKFERRIVGRRGSDSRDMDSQQK